MNPGAGHRHVHVLVHHLRVPQSHRVRLRQRHDGGHQGQTQS